MDFAENLGKLYGSKKTKVYYGGFLRNDFMKGIVILVKVDEMHNILKFASHCFLVKR